MESFKIPLFIAFLLVLITLVVPNSAKLIQMEPKDSDEEYDSVTENGSSEEVNKNQADLTTLRMVQVLHRHGDRTAKSGVYKNALHKDVQLGPKGRAQLSRLGKMQGFKLGEFLRERYDGFISRAYSAAEIHAEASDADRTIMTSETMLAALFPPTPEDPESLWNPALTEWQPIPVHAISATIDNKLRFLAECPMYWKLFYANRATPESLAFIKSYDFFYKYLEKHSGSPVPGPGHELFNLYDQLKAEELYGLSSPKWTKIDSFWDIFLKTMYFGFKCMFATPEMQVLRGGPFFTELVGNMLEKVHADQIGSKNPPAKIYEYAAHETTLGVIATILGVNDTSFLIKDYAKFAPSIVIELHYDEESQDFRANPEAAQDSYFVKFFYNMQAELGHPPVEFFVPNCGKPCSLKDLVKIKSNFLISQDAWHDKCYKDV